MCFDSGLAGQNSFKKFQKAIACLLVYNVLKTGGMS